MNTNNAIQHLNDNELFEAVVDTADLDSARQAHLNACPECTQKLDMLQGRLTRLGQTAKHMAPAPQRPFRLPAKHQTAWQWAFKPLIATGFAAAVLLAIIVTKPHWGHKGPTYDIAADRTLMEEIDALVDNALPVQYQQLALLSAPTTGDMDTQMDDDFLDWIVPPLDDGDNGESII